MHTFLKIDQRQLISVTSIESIVLSKSRVNTLNINLRDGSRIMCQYKENIDADQAFQKLRISLDAIDITGGMIGGNSEKI